MTIHWHNLQILAEDVAIVAPIFVVACWAIVKLVEWAKGDQE